MTTSAPQWPGQEGIHERRGEEQDPPGRPVPVQTSPVRGLPGRVAEAGPPAAAQDQPATYRRPRCGSFRMAPPAGASCFLVHPQARPSSVSVGGPARGADAAAAGGAWAVRGRAGPQGAGAAGGAATGQGQAAVAGGGDAGHRPGAAGGGGGMPECGAAGTGRESRAVGDPGTVHRPARRAAPERPVGHLGPLPGGQHRVWRTPWRWYARATLSARSPSVWTPAAAGGS